MKCLPHAVFIGYFDHSNSIRVAKGNRVDIDRILFVRESFKSRCNEYVELRRLQTQFSQPAHNLYKPAFLTCFGNADDLAIVVIDNLTDFTHIASSSPELMNFTLAIVPEPADLIPQDLVPHGVSPLSISEFVDTLAAEGPILTALSHFKLQGVLSMAFGVNIQSATSQIVALTIAQAVAEMKEKATSHFNGYFDVSDVESLSFTILSPLSTDDLTILFRCNNYSVIARTIAVVRRLTFRNLLDAENLPSCKRISEEIVRSNRMTPYDKLSTLGERFQCNFVNPNNESLFVSTYSNFGCTLNIGEEIAEARFNATGRVGVHCIADVSPGRNYAARKVLEGRDDLSLDAYESQATQHAAEFFLAGRHDLCYRFTPGERRVDFSHPTVSTNSFMKHFFGMFRPVGNETEMLRDSGVQDIVSNLAIPYPSFDNSLNEPSGFTALVLRRIVEELRSQHFRLDDSSSFSEVALQLGLSVAAIGSFKRLYSEFLVALENPLLFDSVLDLIDSFFALYRIVSIDAPSQLLETRSAIRPRLKSKLRISIIESLEDLKAGFYLRVEKATTKRDDRSVRVEVKGCLNSLVAASDASLKCGIGLLRCSIEPDDFLTSSSRKKIAGLISASLHQRPSALFLALPDQGCSTFASVKMDVAHLFEVQQLIRVFHEVAHLIFSLTVCGKSELMFINFIETASVYSSEDLTDEFIFSQRINREQILSWQTEVFAELLVFRLIFDGLDEQSYVDYFMNAFCSSTDNTPGSAQFELSMLEKLIQCFVVCSAACGKLNNYLGSRELFQSKVGEFIDAFSTNGHYPSRAVLQEAALRDAIAKANYLYAATASRIVLPAVDRCLASYFERTRVSAGLRALVRSQVEKRALARELLSNDTLGTVSDELVLVVEILRGYFAASLVNPGSNLPESFLMSQVFALKQLWHLSAKQRFRRFVQLCLNS